MDTTHHRTPKQSANDTQLRAIDSEIRDLEYDRDPTSKGATAHDVREMDALGLTPTFRRRFKFVAMVGFSSTVVIGMDCMGRYGSSAIGTHPLISSRTATSLAKRLDNLRIWPPQRRYWRAFLDVRVLDRCYDLCLPQPGGVELSVGD